MTCQDPIRIVSIDSIQFDDFLKYDETIHPGVERYYWQKCFAKKGSTFYVSLNGDNIVGFGGTRPYKPGCIHIGPLYADTPDIAKVLVKSLVEKDTPFSIEIEAIEPNPHINGLIVWLGMEI